MFPSFALMTLLAADPAKVKTDDLIAVHKAVMRAQAVENQKLSAALAYRDLDAQAKVAHEDARKLVEQITKAAGKDGCTIDLEEGVWNCAPKEKNEKAK